MDAPKLLAVLKEMKDVLDMVRSKVEFLTTKVRQNQLPTAEGIGYLEVKHLLLLSYCQSIVYYVLRKAKGLPIEGHPVVCSLVEIGLFLKKIREIDKKMEYQIQKLTRAADGVALPERTADVQVKAKDESREEEDPLRFRPNPDMLVSKLTTDGQDKGGVYRPPRFMATSIDEDKVSKKEKQASREEKALARWAKQSPAFRGLEDELEDRPEEVREDVGVESKEVRKYLAKRAERESHEEKQFTRAPLTKRDKKMEKYMKSRNGLLGLTDGFDEFRMFNNKEKDNDDFKSQRDIGGGRRKHKKRKTF